jgi:hypothetical protein
MVSIMISLDAGSGEVAARKGWSRPLFGGAISMVLSVIVLGCGPVCSGLPRHPAVLAKLDLLIMQEVLKQYAEDHEGSYPASLGELFAPDSEGLSYLVGPGGEDRGGIRDPWDNPYRYLPPSGRRSRACIWSLGADGRPGGDGADRDLCSLPIRDGGNDEAPREE